MASISCVAKIGYQWQDLQRQDILSPKLNAGRSSAETFEFDIHISSVYLITNKSSAREQLLGAFYWARKMEQQNRFADHRKRKRRRHGDQPPISGWLEPNDHLTGNIGVISSELFAQLFLDAPPSENSGQSSSLLYVAVAPWAPSAYASVEDNAWTVLPVRPLYARQQDTYTLKPNVIQFPVSSPALHSLGEALQANPFRNSTTTHHSGFEVLVVDVVPLSLDTVYVAVDGDALDKHDEVQRKFGGGFLGTQVNGSAGEEKKHKKTVANGSIHSAGFSPATNTGDDELAAAIREALRLSVITREGDLLPLPLPAHPITHAPVPPAQIISCEPVSQGLLTRLTNIIVNRSHRSSAAARPLPSRALHHFASTKSLTDFDTTDGDGTSNEAFHSAIESGDTSGSDMRESSSESEDMGKGSTSSSDDSDGDVISMSTPELAMRPSGTKSAGTAATSKVYVSLANGARTPGSVFSNMTSTTARQAITKPGTLFMAQGLLQKVPDEMLHPKPALDEDDEYRIFIDIKLLVRVGCFSGDWVRIEPIGKTDTQMPAWPTESSGESKHFRPLKIYAIPNLQPACISRSAGGMPRTRKPSVLTPSGSQHSPLNAWLSPLLLANLGRPEAVRITPLVDTPYERSSVKSRSGTRKIESSASPSTAHEVNLLRVATPLSTERAMQTGLFAALKRHFEQKHRIVHRGDMIALPIDSKASRMLALPAQTSEEDEDGDELLALPSANRDCKSRGLEVAWFKVGDVVGPEPLEASDLIPSVWGSVYCIEPRVTRMRQAGIGQNRILPQLASTWQHYLGVRSCTSRPTSQLVRGLTAALPNPYVSAIRRRLRELIAAATSPRALHLSLNPLVILLHSTQRNIGKATSVVSAASDQGVHTFVIDAYDLLAVSTGGGDIKAEALLKARVDRALSCGPANTTILIRHIDALTADRMITAIEDVISEVRVLIATTTEIEKIPESVRSLFTHELEISAPDEGERESLLREILQDQNVRISGDVDLAAIAVKTAALVAGNLVDVVERAIVARQERLEQFISAHQSRDVRETQMFLADVFVSSRQSICSVTKADFDVAVEAARKNFADAIGAPKIPNVSWDDVGGLENIKDAVMETIQLPLERPELFAKGMKKRSGILFYGPPGTGKTLLAKAIATEFSLNFFSIKGPELLNMYIGESEANVRRVFQRARDARPCVVFFDELDSVAPKRGNQGDSGGVMDRIVSQLLAELDGMSDGEEGSGGVFVIGATNRPDLLDQALLRPGRFDKMLYLGISDTHQKQLTILEALTRRFAMHPETSLARVAESLPFTYTGADLYALCSDAMLKAITRKASAVDAKIRAISSGPVTTAYFFDHLAKEEDIAVMVTEADFIAAQMELVGSVSAKELEHYKRVRHEFEGPSNAGSSTDLLTQASKNSQGLTDIDGHLHPPVPTRRPKLPTRSSTLKPKPTAEAKGKGKATEWDSDEDDEDDEDDEAYMTSNDFTPIERKEMESNTTSSVVGPAHGGGLHV
ncbi:MAG: hypothetical protein Q9163_001445 [Psora crenata]